MNIELYIANKLCDLEKSDLSIRLKRQFINPTQLSTKDSQKSYTISLPSTPANDAIFKYGNVEEVQGKFSIYPDAKLYVNGILILDGKFRLSEITRNSYKGNLGVPAPLTVKDVFGETKMNEAGEWPIPYKGAESISEYNNKDNPECIFPFVLYGLMSKTEMKNKTMIDNNTMFAIQDFPPSVNCVQMLKKIFENTTKDGKHYSLSGSALNDKRLQNLYVSYRNPQDYPMAFTYDEIKISGKWSNLIDYKIQKTEAEKQAHINKHIYGDKQRYITCDILQSDNVKIESTTDSGGLLTREGDHISYRAPITGLYKIKLETTIEMPPLILAIDGPGCYILGKDGYFDPKNPDKIPKRDFRNVACEVKLVRHSGNSYDLNNATMDNEFRKLNRDPSKPAYYPEPSNVHFVDPKKKDDILCGFSWGAMSAWNRKRDKAWENRVLDYVNPLLTEQNFHENSHNPIAMKHGNSWDHNTLTLRSCATYSPGYIKDEAHIPEKDDEEIEKYELKVDLENSTTFTRLESTSKGSGAIEQMILLEEGEKITLLSVMDMSSEQDWIFHTIDFDISIEPFKLEKTEEENSWLQMHVDGYSIAKMNWGEYADFLTNQIDLIKFLPSTIKIDEWVSNFCKAFNLELQHKGNLDFELNLRDKQLTSQTSKLIDLDQKTSVQKLINQPFDLPKSYKLGFKLETDEEGYTVEKKEGEKEDSQLGGAGLYETGSIGTEPTTQESNFSYCWYKTLIDNKTNEELSVPVITKNEIWLDRNDYKDMETKKYYDLAQRFWYKKNKTHTLFVGQIGKGTNVNAALVSNTFSDTNLSLSLDYENKPSSIARNYFMLMDNNNNYTTVECYLSPEEYDQLDKVHIKYNGDLYNVAEADGYDPMGKGKTKLKLIKK